MCSAHEGPTNILTAAALTGELRMVKLLGNMKTGEREMSACKALCPSLTGPPGPTHNCVPVDARVLTLTREQRSVGYGPGQYRCLVMARYPLSLATHLPLEAPVLAAGLERMVEAVIWIHSQAHVHMDLKVCVSHLISDGGAMCDVTGALVRQNSRAAIGTPSRRPDPRAFCMPFMQHVQALC